MVELCEPAAGPQTLDVACATWHQDQCEVYIVSLMPLHLTPNLCCSLINKVLHILNVTVNSDPTNVQWSVSCLLLKDHAQNSAKSAAKVATLVGLSVGNHSVLWVISKLTRATSRRRHSVPVHKTTHFSASIAICTCTKFPKKRLLLRFPPRPVTASAERPPPRPFPCRDPPFCRELRGIGAHTIQTTSIDVPSLPDNQICHTSCTITA